MAKKPKVKLPNRIEPITFPAFGISWFIDPTNGRSIIAYAGGGGSAKTGVFNSITVQDNLNFIYGSSGTPDNAIEGTDTTEATTVPISTGDDVGIAMKIYKNPITNNVFMIVGMNKEVRRYSLPIPPLQGDEKYSSVQYDSINVHDSPINAMAVNIMATLIAVGLDNGVIKLYSVSDTVSFDHLQPVMVCTGHTNTICSLSFSLKNNRLLSSAKDGTARVWDCSPANTVLESQDHNKDRTMILDGLCISEMVCSVDDPKAKPNSKVDPKEKNRKPAQVLVRGCAFADLHGTVAVTVASSRRGKAYISQWVQSQLTKQQQQELQENNQKIDPNTNTNQYECFQRTECSMHPISAMSLSDDGYMIALGSVNGTILLWNVMEWKLMKQFTEVHDLPVTCIAARPYTSSTPQFLPGEESMNEVIVHVRSASADNKLACLTLQTKVPRKSSKSNNNHVSFLGLIYYFIQFVILHVRQLICVALLVRYVLYPMFLDVTMKCGQYVPQTIASVSTDSIGLLTECIIHDFLIAPSTRTGISAPLY